ncbi:MAG: hypothetical protein WBI17_13530 [Clostridiaceae bacterium]
MLEILELVELEEAIIQELPDTISHILSRANRTGIMEELLGMLEMTHLLQPAFRSETDRKGKIVVIGESEVTEERLLAIAKGLGLEKKRFEFCLDYDRAQRFDYGKLHYESSYRVVLFGPIPHSTKGKGESSSAITEMERKLGYPRVVRLQNSHALKITQNSFKTALKGLIEENYI